MRAGAGLRSFGDSYPTAIDAREVNLCLWFRNMKVRSFLTVQIRKRVAFLEPQRRTRQCWASVAPRQLAPPNSDHIRKPGVAITEDFVRLTCVDHEARVYMARQIKRCFTIESSFPWGSRQH